MLFHLKEYGKYVDITGYRNLKFAEAEKFLKAKRKETQVNVDLQFFDAQLIATQEHLIFAAMNALQAFRNKTNLSKSLAMETMLYASAQRQIQKAIKQCGIKPQTTSMAVIIIGEDRRKLKNLLLEITKSVGVEPDDNVLELSKFKEKKIIDIFKITDEELMAVVENGNREKTVVNLVIERVALLSTQL